MLVSFFNLTANQSFFAQGQHEGEQEEQNFAHGQASFYKQRPANVSTRPPRLQSICPARESFQSVRCDQLACWRRCYSGKYLTALPAHWLIGSLGAGQDLTSRQIIIHITFKNQPVLCTVFNRSNSNLSNCPNFTPFGPVWPQCDSRMTRTF